MDRLLEQARSRKSNVDWDKVHATSDDDIRRHMIEDGEDPDNEDWSNARVVVAPAKVRATLGLSQPEFAALIQVPVATVRNWEQGRVMPDAAARSLLTIIWREPEAAKRALRAA